MAGYPYTPNGYSGYNPYNYQTAVPNVNAYNSYYPTAVPLQQPQPQNEFKYYLVRGEDGVNAFYVPPGQSVLLMDTENMTFYIKSVDQNGMPLPLRICDYTERVQPQLTGYSQASVDMSSYATHDEIDELKKMIGDLKSSMTREGKQDGRKPTV